VHAPQASAKRELEYDEPRWYATHEPGLRRIEGVRRVLS
jgi:hypothetical protein